MKSDDFSRNAALVFPWIQRAVVLVLGAGGFIYATVSQHYEVFGASAPLILWGGYQELRRADRADRTEPEQEDDPLEGW